MKKIVEEMDLYVVVSNTDLTEGKGAPRYLHYCLSRTTAQRLAKGQGVQGTDAEVRRMTAVRLDEKGVYWYAPVLVTYPDAADKKEDARRGRQEEIVRKALDAGLTKDEIKALRVT